MSTVQNERSSDTQRDVRDVINTGTTTVVANTYAARSLWTETTVPYDTPPNDATTTAWVIS